MLYEVITVIPIRGGFDRAPLNPSNVYFSKYLEANQFAYNYFWNFTRSVLNNKDGRVKVTYMNSEEAEAILKEHDKKGLEAPELIQTQDGKPVNVILVLLESFSDKVIEPLGGIRITSYNVCYTKLLRLHIHIFIFNNWD